MRLLYLFLLLVLSSCSATRHTTQSVEPLSSLTTVAKGDTAHIVAPGILEPVEAFKLPIISSLLGGRKVKNRGTIIIQTGAGSVATPVGKSKAPIATGAGESKPVASQIEKPKAPVAFTTGNNSPAAATSTPKTGFNWYVVAGIAALAFYFYKKFKNT